MPGLKNARWWVLVAIGTGGGWCPGLAPALETPAAPSHAPAASAQAPAREMDFSTREAHERSLEASRESLARLLGVPPERAHPAPLEVAGEPSESTNAPDTGSCRLQWVRWPVLAGGYGEGLLLRPHSAPLAGVVALPDPGQTPEMLAGLTPELPPERQYARRLAENGILVLVPDTLDFQRGGEREGAAARPDAAPQAGEAFARITLMGWEIQKALAAVELLRTADANAAARSFKVGLAGYGGGGFIAFCSAALAPEVDAALVSGCFGLKTRPGLAETGTNARVWGDAEIAALVSPRRLVVEYSRAPSLEALAGERGKRDRTPDYEVVETEFERSRALLKAGDPGVYDSARFITGTEGMKTGPASDRALISLLQGLGVQREQLTQPGGVIPEAPSRPDVAERRRRQLRQWEEFSHGWPR